MCCKCILPLVLLPTIQDSFCTKTYNKIFKALLCVVNVYYPKYFCPVYRIRFALKPITKFSRLYYVLEMFITLGTTAHYTGFVLH